MAAAGVVAMLLAGCAENAPQDFLEPAGDIARQQDRLWDLVFGVAVVVFFIVEGLLVYALIRFRQKPGRRAEQFHGNTRVEVLLTLAPALILAGLAVPTVRSIFDIAAEPEGALRVNVVARQFWWEYEYEDEGFVTANEMHIPVDTPVRVTLQGPDVIHSFWVPRLAGAQDVVPGRTNHLTLVADEPGTYLGQCKEFCGLSHANMRLRVIAHSEAGYDRWVAEQLEPATAESLTMEGARLFLEGQCVNCHAIGGTDAAARSGPDLTHFGSRETFAGAMFRNTDENLRRWLEDPPAMKPGALMPDYGLSGQEIDALVAFLRSLR